MIGQLKNLRAVDFNLVKPKFGGKITKDVSLLLKYNFFMTLLLESMRLFVLRNFKNKRMTYAYIVVLY